MPRYDVIRKKERRIIISAAHINSLCKQFNAHFTSVYRALRFADNSKLSYEIRNAALNEYNGILIER